MRMLRPSSVLGLAVVTLLFGASAIAATTFVRGVNDGLRTYAVVSRNGVEYRTDEMGSTFNKGIWNELSSSDRQALVNAYGWQLNRRAAHFGSDGSAAIATWVDDVQGWTAAAEAMKLRHANKDFPDLVPVFGPDAFLELPDYYCVNPEILNSEDYKQAARLALEIQADYAVGKEIYDMLVAANWEQVSIAVKTLSEPLIKMIVDTFITGFVTNGASKVSELLATVHGFRNDLRDFIQGRMNPGNPPPTPAEMIARLEQYIQEMETTAETAVSLVNTKKAQLEALATSLKAADQALTDAKRADAEAARSALAAKANVVPPPASLEPFTPRNPAGTPAEQEADVKIQVEEFLTQLNYERLAIESQKNAAVNDLRSQYLQHIVPPSDYYEARRYLADVSDGFSRPYFEVIDRLDDVAAWRAAIPPIVSSYEARQAAVAGATTDTNAVIEGLVPDIEAWHAKLLWADMYETLLEYRPTTIQASNIASLRNFGSAIEVAATPDRKVEALVEELGEAALTANAINEGLEPGVVKREQWMRDEANRYDSLRFNFENSLSVVIATLRQIDRLHANPMFLRSEYPFTCYAEDCLYRYSVDVAGIRASIASQTTRLARETARADALRDLEVLRAQEEALLQKLVIAQNSHYNDVANMKEWFASAASRFNGIGSYEAMIAEFEKVVPGTIKGQYDLWNDLVPNITYYYLGDGSWIRNESNLSASIRSSMDLVSGKTDEYQLLLDLYHSMEREKSTYLAMTVAEFDAFQTMVTQKIGSYPTGSWIVAFENDGVWGVEWPAWQLVMKTNWRAEALNSEYRGYGTPAPVAWDIRGRVTTGGGAAGSAVSAMGTAPAAAEGIGIPGVTVVLDGYLTTSTTTDSNGEFLFTWVGNGDFTVTPSGGGYLYTTPVAPLTIDGADTTIALVASETADSGYTVSGRVVDGAATALEAVQVVLIGPGGDAQTAVSGPDGTYSFHAVAPGTYEVRPVDSGRLYTPSTRAVTVPLSVTGADFSGVPSAPSTDLSLWVSLAGTGSGRVTSLPAAIDCPGSCSASFAPGTSVTLTATPAAGSTFAGWFGRCSGTGGCTVEMDDVRSVVAAFELPGAGTDAQAPLITTFSLPETAGTLSVPLTFAAVDDVEVAGYLVTTSLAEPWASDPRWTASPPSWVTFDRPGTHVVFGWVKDAAGNLAEASAIVTVLVAATPAVFHGDFNGDGRDDILLRHSATGDIAVWLMNGTAIEGGGYVGSAGEYGVAGIGDFNGDGRDDLLLRDPLGNIGAWMMNGKSIVAGGLIGSPGSYTVAAVADFDGDLKADILLRDSLGNIGLWFMNGFTIRSGALVGSPGAYTVAGARDFDGDGMADILLRDSLGNLGLWMMTASTIRSGALVGSPGAYSVAGVNDFDGNGKSDILLRDVLGNVGLWFMNGSTIVGGALVGSPGAYSVVSVGDYDGSSWADVLLRDSYGAVGIWLMNGSAIVGGGQVGGSTAGYEVH